MGYEAESQTIQQVFETFFNYPGVEFYFDNVPVPEQDNDAYVLVSIFDGDARQVSMGAQTNYYRNDGIVVFGIHTRKGIGEGEAKRIADHIAGLFRSNQFGGMTFKAPRLDKLGVRDNWYVMNLLVNFHRDELL